MPLLRFFLLPFCAIARIPLNPAALAFVPFGIVLVRVRVRVRDDRRSPTLPSRGSRTSEGAPAPTLLVVKELGPSVPHQSTIIIDAKRPNFVGHGVFENNVG